MSLHFEKYFVFSSIKPNNTFVIYKEGFLNIQ